VAGEVVYTGRFNRKYIKIIPPVLWAAFIFYLSSIPSLKSPFGIWDLYLRKAAHVMEYFILSLLISPNFSYTKTSGRIVSIVIAAVYAVSDEYHQSFVPGRNMSFTDMVWDCIGCLLAYVLLLYYSSKKLRSHKSG
jgi:VanZ family protein